MSAVRVQRIGVVSLAAFVGTIFWAITLFTWWPVIVLEEVVPGSGIALYFFVLLGSLVYGVIVGAISAVIYNFAALLMSGITLELEDTSPS